MEAIKDGAPVIHDGVEMNINNTRHIEWGNVDDAFEKMRPYPRRPFQDIITGTYVYGNPWCHFQLQL